jgi:hypothetical protein
MFKRFANHLSSHPLQRHLVFLGLAFLAIVINGYHFGTFDQVFHITFLKKFVNPDLYPGDPFLSLRWYHFSYFWFGFIPFMKAGLLEVTLFFVHLLTIYGTFWMFWALSESLFQSPEANLLITVALLFPHLGLPGFQIIEFSLLNRTFVLPFLLGSIVLFLRNQKIPAYLILGLMYNLHVIYATFVLCMFLLDTLLRFRWRNILSEGLNILIFVITALPVLLWRLDTGNGIDLTLRPEMLQMATNGLLYTVYYPIGRASFMLGNLLAGIGTVWAFILGQKTAGGDEKHRTIRHFAYAIAVLVFIALITSYLFPITILVQMQILRVAVFMLYFGMLYFSHFMVDQINQKRISKNQFLVLGLSFALLVTPLIAIGLWYLQKHLLQRRWSKWPALAVILLQIVILSVSLNARLWAPGIHIFGPDSAWRDTQNWARENTYISDRFITPPHIFWHYTPDWRVFSERPALVTIPEMMEIPFDPDFADSFEDRFSELAPGALAAFNGNYMQTLEITKAVYYQNTSKDFSSLGCQFSAEYLVVDSDHPYDFEIIYQNKGYIIYRLPPCQ